MATRQSVGQLLEQCEGALRFADYEYNEASRLGHYSDEEFQKSQLYIEEALTNLDKMFGSADAQQRDMLQRMQQQLNDIKNDMILLRH